MPEDTSSGLKQFETLEACEIVLSVFRTKFTADYVPPKACKLLEGVLELVRHVRLKHLPKTLYAVHFLRKTRASSSSMPCSRQNRPAEEFARETRMSHRLFSNLQAAPVPPYLRKHVQRATFALFQSAVRAAVERNGRRQTCKWSRRRLEPA